MMYKLICILKCLTLVATNPLQELQSCPQVKYVHNYGQPDGPLITPSNYKPYQQQLVVQDQIPPTIQTIPYLHNDQISRLYYKVIASPTVNSFADANTRVYDQNGIEIIRYVANPNVATPNVVNNYILLPPEYFKVNQSVPNEKYYPRKKKLTKGDNEMKNNELSEVENHKNKKIEHVNEKHTYNYTNDKPTSDKHGDDVPKKKAKRKEGSKVNKSKRKSSKKNKKKCQKQESSKVIDEDDLLLKPDKKRTHNSKLKALENESDKEVVEQREVKTTTRRSDDNSKITDKKIEKKKKLKTCQEKCIDSEPTDHEVTSDDCEKVVVLTPQFIEIDQINDPLISEKTSPNIEKNQDKTIKVFLTKEFENDKTDIESPPVIVEAPSEIVDPPLKIIETPPKIIAAPREIIEPLPEIIEPPSEIIEPPSEIIEPTREIIEPTREIIKPLNIYAIDNSEETLYASPVLGDEDIPFLNDNDVIDEYYPDFTSDNLYLSKEDYEYNNFHDRYYYASDNKAKMSREKRRYEHVKGKKLRKSDDVHNKKQEVNNIKGKKSIQRHKDTLKDKENPSETKFHTPPPLEFPDFKTEMVNKDRDNPRKENEHIQNERQSEISKNLDHDNEVETVFAHSKVVKYGASPNTQEATLFDFTQTNIGDEKIIFSRDGDTTVIIARSLGYPEDY
ncbi:uncharacterized protein LOC126779041 [Nymphalis io]|uniref:uncharacterized protein LOC126779041 n=1 Tax=Inachis io TaxID=171585 RepID=UPI002166EDFF|nr:uncharacterized protein LOC126779041 [Nymphalis io]